MKIKNATYNYIKWVVSVVLPACAVLVGTLGKAYNWNGTDLAVTTIAAVTTFLGSIMLYSTAQYNKNGADNNG